MSTTNNSNVELRLAEVADRVHGLRLDMGLTPEEVASKLDITTEEYLKFEEGTQDFNFTFIYKFANLAGVEISDIMEGSSPALTEYAVTRNGQGSPITRRTGYKYQRLASRFKNKLCEPFRVVVPYSEEALNPPYKLVTHGGQEINIVVRGSLKVMLGDSFEVLHEGDVPLTLSNALGSPNQIVEQQIYFPGVRSLTFTERCFVSFQIRMQFNITGSHYLLLDGGIARATLNLKDIANDWPNLWGASIGYCYYTFLGPIEALLGYSSLAPGMNFYLSLGHRF